MRKVLVTGAAGFIGSNLVRALLDAGHSVRCFDDLSRGKYNRLEGVAIKDFIHGDIRYYPHVADAVQGRDTIIHLAAINGTRHFYERPAEVLEVAVKGIVNIVQACEADGIKRDVLVASSSEVYQTPPIIPTPEDVPLSIPDPLNPRYSYAVGKILTEMLALHAGCFERVVVFRPHNIYGPDMGEDHVIPQFARRLLALPGNGSEHPFVIQGDGRETRSFCYIDDVVNGIVTLLDKGEHRGIYNIGSDDLVAPIGWLAVLIADLLGRKIQTVVGKRLPGSTIYRQPDVTKLRSLGWEPKTLFAEGLQKTINWYKEHPCPAS